MQRSHPGNSYVPRLGTAFSCLSMLCLVHRWLDDEKEMIPDPKGMLGLVSDL